jgi:hypothetical protein
MLQCNLTYPVEGTLLSAGIGETRTVYEINYVSNHAHVLSDDWCNVSCW